MPQGENKTNETHAVPEKANRSRSQHGQEVG